MPENYGEIWRNFVPILLLEALWSGMAFYVNLLYSSKDSKKTQPHENNLSSRIEPAT